MTSCAFKPSTQPLQRVFALLGSLLVGLSSPAVHTQGRVDTPTVADASTTTPDPQGNATEVFLLLSSSEKVNQMVRAVAHELDVSRLRFIDSNIASSPQFRWPENGTLVTVGQDSCRLALEARADIAILCSLLTEEEFNAIAGIGTKDSQTPATVLVLDQPLSRQARVAHSIYPGLTRFSVLSARKSDDAMATDTPLISNFPYHPDSPLPEQLTETLRGRDALIATPEHALYNPTNLSTILLTAYGHGKPLIGYSRAYVTAGALLTCYSTPGQIMRQISEMIAEGRIGEPRLVHPDAFSVVDNPSVARSLGLDKGRLLDPGRTYTDADFPP